jgi:hypothetical protein
VRTARECRRARTHAGRRAGGLPHLQQLAAQEVADLGVTLAHDLRKQQADAELRCVADDFAAKLVSADGVGKERVGLARGHFFGGVGIARADLRASARVRCRPQRSAPARARTDQKQRRWRHEDWREAPGRSRAVLTRPSALRVFPGSARAEGLEVGNVMQQRKRGT